MTATAESRRIIWRFTDSRAGHDSQSLGLVSALTELCDCEVHEIGVPFELENYWQAFQKNLEPVKSLPDPDLLVGAGHATHFPMLACRFARGGKICVIMSPSLPRWLFDLCLLPEHDRPGQAENTIVTMGPLNSIQPRQNRDEEKGLVLVGGQSKHFLWSNTLVLEQIKGILESGFRWSVSDSPRTPPIMREQLRRMAEEGLDYRPYEDHPARELMQDVAQIWVSEDSMSMIFEALSTGSAVGVMRLRPRRKSRLGSVATTLFENNLLTLYDHYQGKGRLPAPSKVLQESQRVARAAAEKLGWL